MNSIHDAIAQMFYNEMPYCEDDVAHLGKPSWDSDRDSPLKARARLRADQVFELVSQEMQSWKYENPKGITEQSWNDSIDQRCSALSRKRRQSGKAKR